jgi:endonuclease/exonuclease/phosphatase family metal-dependent hydrolase
MTTFRAMTWNVENLFRPPLGADAAERQRYERKLELLASVIGGLSPDVVALQEVGGGEEPLQDLQEALDGAYPHRAVSAFPDNRDIQVAFLSKHAIDEHTDLVDLPPGPALDVRELSAAGERRPVTRLGRGALRVRVAKEGLTVDLITAHLKSKLLSFPRPGGETSFFPRDEEERAQVAGLALERRTAEAVALRIRANELLEGNATTPLIVLGDFNDVPEAQTSLILNGPPGSEIGTEAFHNRDEGDDARLFNLAPRISNERRFSRIHNGRRELLDQILASEELFPVGADGRRPLQEADSHVDFRDGLPSVEDDPAVRAEDVAPDHAPVTATFEL